MVVAEDRWKAEGMNGNHEPGPRRDWRHRVRSLGPDIAYLMVQFPLHLVAFVLVVTVAALGLGTMVVWIGIPILCFALLIARGFAQLQRSVNGMGIGVAAPSAPYAVERSSSWWRELTRPIRDAQSWFDLLWIVVGFPLSALTWVVAIVWIVTPMSGLATPVIELIEFLAGSQVFNGLGKLFGFRYDWLFDSVFGLVVGSGFAWTAPSVLRGCVRLLCGFSDLVLSSRARNQESIEHLSESRAAARQAEARSLRRLERDLHDGPQQRLVRLQMDLARAKRRLDDPEQGAALIDAAIVQTQETLAELRQLSRGIAPPILADRGLEAAVVESAARSIVPVTVAVDVPELPEHVATTGYFVISEALANINKHSKASSALIEARVLDGELQIWVGDDGVGGAEPAKGFGLVGMAERLHAVDGTLAIDSPEGGPTILRMVIPCA